jgi:lambda family phage tail tape measure protein
LARSIIKDLLSIMIQAQMANLAKSLFGSSGGGGGILGSIFGGLSGMSNSGDSVLSDWGGWSIGANGFAMQGGRRLAFAAGGIVNGPTIFPMANGMGLMGEAGPEAIMPLKRGSDGKLGVASTGSNITVNVPINGITDKSLVTDLKNSIEERVVEVIRRHS